MCQIVRAGLKPAPDISGFQQLRMFLVEPLDDIVTKAFRKRNQLHPFI
jgi:hypothetical protein